MDNNEIPYEGEYQNSIPPKKSYWKVYGIIITIIILIGLLYFVYVAARVSIETNAYNIATMDIAIQQTQTGNIVYAFLNENNQTALATTTIEEICAGR